MSGQSNLKFKKATGESEDFFKAAIKEAKELPNGAMMKTESRIQGSVNLTEDGKRDIEFNAEFAKTLIGAGAKVDFETVSAIQGEATFSVTTLVVFDKTSLLGKEADK